LNALAPSDPRLVGAQDFLINNQDIDGAWQGDALATAVAATTLLWVPIRWFLIVVYLPPVMDKVLRGSTRPMALRPT